MGRSKQKRKSTTKLDTSTKEESTENANESISSDHIESPLDGSYTLGDIVWSKVPGHPWWPSMIYFPPEGDKYVSLGRTRSFHVQFFGPLVERAWIPDTRLLPYQGRPQLNDQLEAFLKNIKNPKQRSKLDNNCKPKLKPLWDASWQEADTAAPMARELRVERFGRVYVGGCGEKKFTPPPSPAPSTLAAATASKKITPVTSDSEASKSKAPVQLSKDEDTFGLENFIRFRHRRRCRRGDRESTGGQQEEGGDEEIRAKWEEMSVEEKWKFVCQSHEPVESKVSGRKIKVPSKELRSCSPVRRKRLARISFQEGPVKRQKLDSEDSESASEVSDSVFDFEIQRLLASPGPFSIQPVCCKCERFDAAVVPCTGICHRSFHPSCVGHKGVDKKTSSTDFKCAECSTSNHSCSLCPKNSQAAGPVIPCKVSSCGRFYHLACVKRAVGFQLEGSCILSCSAHMCMACYLESPTDPRCSQGNLLQCVRCPVAYHANDLCVPPGSLEMSLSSIVCFSHIHRNESKIVHCSACFVCGKSSKEILCTECPANYHFRCYSIRYGTPTGHKAKCPSCQRHLNFRHGQVVWSKVGSFRWWPCEIIHPRNGPHNIMRMLHGRDTFLVHFLGSTEYQWMRKGQVFAYSSSMKIRSLTRELPMGDLNVALEFRHGVRLAKWLHRFYVSQVQKHVPLVTIQAAPISQEEIDHPPSMDPNKVDEKTPVKAPSSNPPDAPTVTPSTPLIPLTEPVEIKTPKPPKKVVIFKFIKENEPIDVKIEEVPLSKMLECDCPSDMVDPCGPYSGCQNVAMDIECHPELCRAGPRCLNQRFTKRQYPLQSVFMAGNRGHGLQALVDIKAGSFVNEYVGELISQDEAHNRLERAHNEGITDFYMLQLDKERVIDAGPKGNLSRYVNHSCSPNLVARKWVVNGGLRIGLFALRDIQAKEELTFNYQFMVYGEEKMPCLCGAPNCSGFLGEKPIKSDRRSRTSKTSDSRSITSSAPDLDDVWDDEVDELPELPVCPHCCSYFPKPLPLVLYSCVQCFRLYHPDCARRDFYYPLDKTLCSNLDWLVLSETFRCTKCRDNPTSEVTPPLSGDLVLVSKPSTPEHTDSCIVNSPIVPELSSQIEDSSMLPVDSTSNNEVIKPSDITPVINTTEPELHQIQE